MNSAEHPQPPRSSASRADSRLARRGGAVELLRVPAALFGAAAKVRRALYDASVLPIHRLDVPVVCVGNLSTGGTGKTPMCALVAQRLAHRGLLPGILSRGYGSSRGPNDEALLLTSLLPGVPHVQDRDRVAGGRRLVERGCGSIVLDDGFQHRRLHRDLDLVLVDATRPWGLPAPGAGEAPVRALLPRGLLREPPSSLARAAAIVLTRVSQSSAADVERLEREIERFAPGKPILRADHRPARLRDESGAVHPLHILAGREVDLASGIGNPEAFERSVQSLGAQVRTHRVFPDHHEYVAGDLAALGADGRALVVTAKDAVKLMAGGTKFLALEIDLVLTSGEAVLEALLDSLAPGTKSIERAALRAGMHG
ncbi:MAG: tetraacyldisaccharide 4'-kinase [Planctomycetota bacterium]